MTEEEYAQAVAAFREAVESEPYRLVVIQSANPLQSAQEALQAAVAAHLDALPAGSMAEALDPAVRHLFGPIGDARVTRVTERPDGTIDIEVGVLLRTPLEHVTVEIDLPEEAR